MQFLILAVLVGLCAGGAIPGQTLLWSQIPVASRQHKEIFITRTVTPQFVSDVVNEKAKGFETIVFVKSENFAATTESFNNAEQKTHVRFVYQDGTPSISPISDKLTSSAICKDVKKIKSEDLAKIATEQTENINCFEVTLTAAGDDMNALSKKNLGGKKILFVAVAEPSLDAVLPPARPAVQAQQQQAGGRRRLADGAGTLFYKPEGAEYSIYYADTYLYITPDIFTGLLTAIFFFFTILIGVTCLGRIQGMSMFYDKSPPVGKEA
jgi:hypothetical protein